ncbi:MAG: SAM-dependent chlorinase/fluorinase [Acidobacteria bacterium]|nr:SAM-dependent chlorinase/fluorinase [Acidobacteriota bacterium]MBV9184981.1 SAM-dependent chlorinase/fluorinase [Acidobacteriota bacterium]
MRTIALLTDFGTRDPYVAAMKGVIASRCEAAIIDLTHDIAPFDIWEAAFFLRDVVRYWPAGTIFVCVVDPGVGTARRIVAVESDERLFLAPDNGLLHFVRGDAFDVTAESLFLADGSTTFHGRDRFAPVAAALANGKRIDDLGPQVGDRVPLDYTPGAIIRIDRFGNCITDLVPPATPFAVAVKDWRIEHVRTTYTGDGAFLIIGSTGCIEISVANGSAASLLQLSRGDRVTIVPK